MAISQILAFLLPTLALNLTPGPDMFFVVGQATKRGGRGAVKAAGGLALGYLFHIALVSAGLATLLHRYPQAYVVLKFLGASYLLALGAKMLLNRQPNDKPAAEEEASLWEGVFVSALNPKVAVFFLAFLPQFIETGTASPGRQLICLGLVFGFTSTAVNLGAGALALWLHRPRAGSRRLPLERICGVALVGMAARLAMTSTK